MRAMSREMIGVLLALLLILLSAALFGAYLVYARRLERKRKIALILEGVDLLARWRYTPEEWRAVEEEFGWEGRGGAGEAFITQSAIYVRGGSGERLIELGGVVVTHASYSGVAGSPLKLRVRWRVVTSQADGADEISYFKEDYRLPVPARHGEDAKRVAAFFTARLESNLDAYAAVVPEDEPISLFGKDGF